MSEHISVCGLRDFNVPEKPAGSSINSEQMRIQSSHVQRVAEDGQASIHAATAGPGVCGGGVWHGPEHPTGGGVKSNHIVRCLHRIQDAVHNKRCRFEFLQ